jgi:hypothetical protein
MAIIKRLLHKPRGIERAYFNVLTDNGAVPGRPTFDEFQRDMAPIARVLHTHGL